MKLHTRVYHYRYVTFTKAGGFRAVSFIKLLEEEKPPLSFLIKVDLFCCPYLDGELAAVQTESARLIAYA